MFRRRARRRSTTFTAVREERIDGEPRYGDARTAGSTPTPLQLGNVSDAPTAAAGSRDLQLRTGRLFTRRSTTSPSVIYRNRAHIIFPVFTRAFRAGRDARSLQAARVTKGLSIIAHWPNNFILGAAATTALAFHCVTDVAGGMVAPAPLTSDSITLDRLD